MALISTDTNPLAEVKFIFGKKKERRVERVNLIEIVDVKGWKARGNRLSQFQVIDVKAVDLAKTDEPEIIIAGEEQKDLFE